MPSVANMFADFLKVPDEHKQLLFTFYDILYNSQPIVDHKLFKAFMDLSNENKMILTDFTQKFGELFKAEHFVKNYILESPEKRIKFQQKFLVDNTELQFTQDTRSQLANIFENYVDKNNFNNMQKANLIGQVSHHPSKNERLQAMIAQGGIDYPSNKEEQAALDEFILSISSKANPIPCEHIKPCEENFRHYLFPTCPSADLIVTSETPRNQIACFILSNLNTNHRMFVSISSNVAPSGTHTQSERIPLHSRLASFVVTNYHRIELSISDNSNTFIKWYLEMIRFCCSIFLISEKEGKHKLPMIYVRRLLSFINYMNFIGKKTHTPDNIGWLYTSSNSFIERQQIEEFIEQEKAVFSSVTNYIQAQETLLRVNMHLNDCELAIGLLDWLKTTPFCGITLYIDSLFLIYDKPNNRQAATKIKNEMEEFITILQKTHDVHQFHPTSSFSKSYDWSQKISLLKTKTVYDVIERLLKMLINCSNLKMIQIIVERNQNILKSLFEIEGVHDFAFVFDEFCKNNIHLRNNYELTTNLNVTSFSLVMKKKI